MGLTSTVARSNDLTHTWDWRWWTEDNEQTHRSPTERLRCGRMAHNAFSTSTLATSVLAAGGLLGGFAVARQTGNRQLGGAVLAAVGVACTTSWNASSGPKVAGALLGTYLFGFGASHPLAKQIGAWPAVCVAAGATAAASVVLTSRD